MIGVWTQAWQASTNYNADALTTVSLLPASGKIWFLQYLIIIEFMYINLL